MIFSLICDTLCIVLIIRKIFNPETFMKTCLYARNEQLDLVLELDEQGRQIKFAAGSLDFDRFPVDFEVQDDLAGRIFCGRNAKVERTDDNSTKYFWQDADFFVTEKWYSESDHLVRKMQITANENASKRSVALRMLLSYPQKVYSLKCWSANERFPSEIAWVGGLELFYEDVCYGTLIPAVALYDSSTNCGLTVGSRPGAFPGGRLSFTFRDYQREGVDVAFSCLLLSGTHPVECELLYAPTEGCFRSALAFWCRNFPDYFEAKAPETCQAKGPFLITNPQMEESVLEKLARKYSPLWAELHNYFGRYGEYAPESAEWTPIIKKDYPAVECEDKFSLQSVNDHIARLHRHNIQAMVYLQATGDCSIPYAEECFPDSIARNSAGNMIKTWIDCCFTSAMPGTSFHDHLVKQIHRFFAVYPELDGVFLDQLCYHAMDYAHADGKTAVNCREAARFGDSYLDTVKLISEYLHKSGKALWANGPFSLEVAREVDGMMSEGTGSIAGSYQYLTCGSKGLLIHSYASSAADVESMFRYCLICGGSWSISGDAARKVPEEYPAKVEYLFEKCGPLVDLIAGCRWVLEAAPFVLPEEYKGNLFVLPDGRLALTVVSSHDTLTRSSRGADESFKAKIKCRAAGEVKQAMVHSVDGVSACSVGHIDGGIEIEISNHRVFSVVLFDRKSV